MTARALASEFNALLVRENERFRDLGLEPSERCAAFLAAALAVADLDAQKTMGRTLDEAEFGGIAMVIYRLIREAMTKGPAS